MRKYVPISHIKWRKDVIFQLKSVEHKGLKLCLIETMWLINQVSKELIWSMRREISRTGAIRTRIVYLWIAVAV
jgi:hypothetical protein